MKKFGLFLCGLLGLTACRQTPSVPQSHYDRLADEPLH
jgi:hypothetical protein